MSVDYDTYWKDYKSGPPAQDPCESHHLRFTPDPEFVALCRDASAQGMHVELVASRLVGPKDAQYRHLAAIQASRNGDDSRVLAAIGLGDTIRSASTRARRILESIP